MTIGLPHIQEGIHAGNEQCLAELYRLFSKRLHHFARVITRSPEIAEEIVEDVFVKLWSNRHRINEVENLTVYLYVAVKNRSLNAISQKATELIRAPFDDLDIEASQVTTDPYNLLITAEMMKRMQQAVDNLPPRCKMIFKLVREDGLKHREVAEILNISLNTVDVQMAIAIKKICTDLNINRTAKSFGEAAVRRES
ncbi:RNA polymerase subunit sigma-24 [Niastella vici]|uniref:RNA polymerase subunit sigma-24 n=1 Tax=Niastella vici TaxID=1703345 RepID=A0A1V9G148_9BACT|nr:RNA polymerase sigma-70 factor [Niastella vici]OQP64351.1 RNA polymerase subunit sigma-24 [Niastella vici]